MPIHKMRAAIKNVRFVDISENCLTKIEQFLSYKTGNKCPN